MPAAVNIAVNLTFGATMALVTRRSPAMRGDLGSWPFMFLLAFEALLFTPVATYLFRFYPQWSMLYAIDPQIYPQIDSWIGVLSALAIVANFAAAIAGYLVTRAGLLSKRRLLVALPYATAAALVLFVVVLYGERVIRVGDYDEFWHGDAVLFVKRVAGWVGLALYAVAGGFLLWVNRHFRNHDPSIM